METPEIRGTSSGDRTVGAVLFLCLFAAQAGAVALSPVLVGVAQDLDVSTATAGQLRTIAGLVAGVTALTLGGRLRARVGLGRQLLAGSILLALGSLLSAAAPGIAVLALDQVPVGAGIGILTTAGTLAAGEWVSAERRPTVLSWALIGQPTAWIVGMPLLGVVGAASWRYTWLVLPLSAALLAAAAVARRRGAPPPQAEPARLRAALAVPDVRRWLIADVLTSTAWAGTLVYAGALFVQSYRTSFSTTGLLLSVGACAYVAGNVALRRVATREPWPWLVGLALALAVAVAAFGAVRISLAASTILFAAAGLAAGGRMLVSSSFGLSLPPDLRPGATAMRSASMQFGYFTGSLTAGAALALGGYPGLGATMGVLFLGAALVLAGSRAEKDWSSRLLRTYPRRVSVDAARLRLVDFDARLPVVYGIEARAGRAARAARTKTAVVGPSDLRWQVRLLILPSGMRPHPPSEMLALSDPSTGWTPLPLGLLLAALMLPFLPLVVLLRSLRVLPWTVEARTYSWGRRKPPIVFAYEVRGRDEAVAAVAELAAALARGSGGPVLPGC